MRLSHGIAALSAAFDEPNLIASAGLVPAVARAARVVIAALAQGMLTVPTHAGANPGVKVMSLVAGMTVGAAGIDDMRILRHAATDRVFTGVRARRRWARSCERSPSGTCGSWTWWPAEP